MARHRYTLVRHYRYVLDGDPKWKRRVAVYCVVEEDVRIVKGLGGIVTDDFRGLCVHAQGLNVLGVDGHFSSIYIGNMPVYIPAKPEEGHDESSGANASEAGG